MSEKDINPGLALGKILYTTTTGRVRIKECVNDEVHCVVVGGKAQLMLSRIAASRRVFAKR